MLKRWKVEGRLNKWMRENREGQDEHAVHCLINEMQVLIRNGWAHV